MNSGPNQLNPWVNPTHGQLWSNLSFEVALALLGGECLAHAERDAALVQCLVGGDRDADFITDSQQQQPALSTVDCHLPDQLV